MQNSLPVVLIPAFKPSPDLLSLADELIKIGFPFIVVVEDGLDESQSEIFEELRSRDRIVVLSHAINLGKGAALKTGFNYLLVNHPEIKGVVTADADGQHAPDDILNVARKFNESENSLILGARQFGQKIPIRSRIGNVVTKYVFRFLVGRALEDTQTGLRALTTKLMKAMLPVHSNRYEFELDMLLAAARMNLPIDEIPIKTIYEDGNKSSHFNPFLDSLRIYFVFLRFVSNSLVTYCADVAVFTALYWASKKFLLSFVIGRAAGLLVTMVGARNFVFKSDKRMAEVAAKFVILWVALLGLSYSLTLLLIQWIHFNVYVSRVTVDSLLFMTNFLIQRDLIFNSGLRFWTKISDKETISQYE